MTCKIIPKFSRWLLLGLCACVLSLGIGWAQAASPFFWDFINVDIALQSNGDMVVTETQKYTFTAEHTNQRYRYIPLDRLDRITDVTVYEGDNQLPAQTGIQDNQYWIRWRHELNAPESHTFKVQYRVVGGVKTQGAHSQIFWRALFPERSADIKQGQVTVHLPEELAGQVDQFTSQGIAATNQQVDDRTFKFTVTKPLAPQVFLDVKVRFPSGILDIAESQNQDAMALEPKEPAIANPSPKTNLQEIWVLILQWCGFMTVVSLMLWGLYLRQSACLNCGKRGVYRINRVIRKSTTERKGEKEVGYVCCHCNYRRTHREEIPKRRTVSSSNSSSYGGYGGGASAGGGCSGGGGGGGCGGGGGGGCGGGGGG
ncbi:MAG: DUF2207 domain-containing protein [Cyanobacteria bacterium P01_C01_bin.120]